MDDRPLSSMFSSTASGIPKAKKPRTDANAKPLALNSERFRETVDIGPRPTDLLSFAASTSQPGPFPRATPAREPPAPRSTEVSVYGSRLKVIASGRFFRSFKTPSSTETQW